MRYFHGSKSHHAIGLRLTGPATRGEHGSWFDDPQGVADAKRTGKYDDRLVYVFEGDGDPLSLLDGFVFSGSDKFLYEVEPERPLLRDEGSLIWKSRACRAATVTA